MPSFGACSELPISTLRPPAGAGRRVPACPYRPERVDEEQRLPPDRPAQGADSSVWMTDDPDSFLPTTAAGPDSQVARLDESQGYLPRATPDQGVVARSDSQESYLKRTEDASSQASRPDEVDSLPVRVRESGPCGPKRTDEPQSFPKRVDQCR